jgi:hypothetical protein
MFAKVLLGTASLRARDTLIYRHVAVSIHRPIDISVYRRMFVEHLEHPLVFSISREAIYLQNK